MGKKINTAKLEEQEWELEDMEPVESDRIVPLKKEPLPRKAYLIRAGVQEIRCVCCVRITLIANAEECGDGWICGDCLSDMEKTQKYGGLHR